MFSKTKAFIQHCFSFVLPFKVASFESAINGKLTVWYTNGHHILDAQDVNYSFNSLHRIFSLVFKKVNLRLSSSNRVLLLGLGCGSVVYILRNELKSGCKIKAVEIDPLILTIAKKYFRIDGYHDLNIVVADADEYIKNENEKYDLIVVDLFINDQVPKKFLTKEFVNRLCSNTNQNGSIVFNMIVADKQQREENDQLYKFFKSFDGSVSRIPLMDTNSMLVWKNN